MFFHALSNSSAFRILPFISSSSSYILHLASKAFHLLDLEHSRKIFVFGYSFESTSISLALRRAGSVTTDGLSINRCSHSELTSLTRENKNDQSRSSGFGDCKGSMRFTQSFVFFFLLLTKDSKGGSYRRVRILRTLKANSSHLPW